MYDRDKRSASGSEFFVGLLVVALLVFLLWYFLLRPREVPVGTIALPAAITAAPGDTLEKALQKVGVTPSPQPTPTATPRPRPAPSPTPVIYTVRAGDSISSIASNFGISVDAIVVANKLKNPDVISVGQELQIPLPGP